MQNADKFIILSIQKYNHLKKKADNKVMPKQSEEEEHNRGVTVTSSSQEDQSDQINQSLTEEPMPVHNNPRLDKGIILSAIPKIYKGKANALLDHMPPSTTWNEKGEAVIEGATVQGSHMSDLLRDTQRQYRSIVPTGRDMFWKVLKDHNIPHCLIGNEHFFHKASVPGTKPEHVKKVKRTKAKPYSKWIKLWE